MRRLLPITAGCLAAGCLVTGFLAAGFVSAALAQQPGAIINRWPGDPEPAAPAPAPPPPATPAPAPAPAAPPASAPAATPQPQAPAAQRNAPPPRPRAAKPRAKPAPAAHTLACAGAFAKNTSEQKLAAQFGKDNVVWTQVDGPEASKLDATVLFPTDPKRRLEVLWTNAETRSDVQVIAINGQSAWTAPKGLKLGLTVAALEKLNGKPFSMKGFGGDTSGQVTSWNGGALAALPGGCMAGVRFSADPKAGPLDASIIDGKEFLSNLPALKTAQAKVAEILIGY